VTSNPTTEATSRHPALHTAACELFGVRYPIIQTGMGWVATPELASATSNAGALGILASGTLNVAETEAAILLMKELTDQPFAVNMRGDAPDINDRAQLLIKHGVKIASFALAPKERVIKDLKDAGLVVRAVATPAASRRRSCCRRWLTPSTSRCSVRAASTAAAASWRPSPTARPASRWAPGSC
jgi:hypothetical protein